MQAKTQILALALAGATALGAMAADAPSTFADNWYLGAGLGSARAKFEDSSVTAVLAGTGTTATTTSRKENNIEGKLFLGYQFNRFVAAEGGYFRLGNFAFDTTTAPAGTVHGGLAATLLDSCMGLAIWTTLDKGVGQTTLEFKISLVRPITPETGVIKAEGIVLNRGRRVGTAEGKITDDKGRLLAHGTTTCLIFES